MSRAQFWRVVDLFAGAALMGSGLGIASLAYSFGLMLVAIGLLLVGLLLFYRGACPEAVDPDA